MLSVLSRLCYPVDEEVPNQYIKISPSLCEASFCQLLPGFSARRVWPAALPHPQGSPSPPCQLWASENPTAAIPHRKSGPPQDEQPPMQGCSMIKEKLQCAHWVSRQERKRTYRKLSHKHRTPVG